MELEGATIAIPFESMAELTGRAPRVTVFMSRYPGEPPILPPAPGEPDYYSHHISDTGDVITYRWEWLAAAEDWIQRSPLFAENVAVARLNVPPEAVRVPLSERCPVKEAFEIWMVRR